MLDTQLYDIVAARLNLKPIPRKRPLPHNPPSDFHLDKFLEKSNPLIGHLPTTRKDAQILASWFEQQLAEHFIKREDWEDLKRGD